MPFPAKNAVWWLPAYALLDRDWLPSPDRFFFLTLFLGGGIASYKLRRKAPEFACLILLTFMSLLVAAGWPLALLIIPVIPASAILTGFLAWTSRHKATLRWLLFGIVLIHALVGIALWFWSSSGFVSPEVGKRASGVFETPLAFYAFPIVGFCLSASVRCSRPIHFWWSRVACLLFGVAIVLTVTRSAAIGLTLASLILCLPARRIDLLLLGLLCATSIFAWREHSPEASHLTAKSTAARPRLWSEAGRLVGQEPLVGSGALSFFRSRQFLLEGKRGIPPIDFENLPLQLAADYGIPLALSFFAVVGLALRKKESEDEWLTGAVTAFLGASMFDVQILGTMIGISASTLWCLLIGFGLRSSLVPRFQELQSNSVSNPL